MKTLNKLVLFLLLVVLWGGCVTIHKSKNMLTQVSKHKIIAILPTEVSFKDPEEGDNQTQTDIRLAKSVNLQQRIYYWLLFKKEQGELAINIMDIETTNTRLGDIGYTSEATMSPAIVTDSLKVDGVIVPHLNIRWGSYATGYLGNFAGRPRCADINLKIYDSETQEMIWKIRSRDYTGHAFFESAIDDLLRKSTKKIPYIIKTK